MVTPQAESFDEGGPSTALRMYLDAAGETECAQGLTEGIGCAEWDAVLDDDQPAAAEALDDLGIEQLGIDDPVTPALVGGLQPLAEMGGQRIEIQC